MKRQQGSLLALFVAAAWPLIAPYVWEFLREFVLYEYASKLLHIAIDGIPGDTLGRLVPSFVLAGIALLLFLRGRAPPTVERTRLIGESDPAAAPTKESRQWVSSYRVLKLANPNAQASREDLYEKLRAGELVAAGFLHPIHPHAEEIRIPAAQWRTLRFNPDFTEAHGRNIKYVGIAVAVAAALIASPAR